MPPKKREPFSQEKARNLFALVTIPIRLYSIIHMKKISINSELIQRWWIHNSIPPPNSDLGS